MNSSKSKSLFILNGLVHQFYEYWLFLLLEAHSIFPISTVVSEFAWFTHLQGHLFPKIQPTTIELASDKNQVKSRWVMVWAKCKNFELSGDESYCIEPCLALSMNFDFFRYLPDWGDNSCCESRAVIFESENTFMCLIMFVASIHT